MPVYTRQDLSIMQAWPLERKIRVTQAKILEWYHHYGGKIAVMAILSSLKMLPDASIMRGKAARGRSDT